MYIAADSAAERDFDIKIYQHCGVNFDYSGAPSSECATHALYFYTCSLLGGAAGGKHPRRNRDHTRPEPTHFIVNIGKCKGLTTTAFGQLWCIRLVPQEAQTDREAETATCKCFPAAIVLLPRCSFCPEAIVPRTARKNEPD